MRPLLCVLAFAIVLGAFENTASARLLELRPPTLEPVAGQVDLFPESLAPALDAGGGGGAWSAVGWMLVGVSGTVGVIAAIPMIWAFWTLATHEEGTGSTAEAFGVFIALYVSIPIFTLALGGVGLGLLMTMWGSGGGDGVAMRTERPLVDRRLAALDRPACAPLTLPAFAF